MKFNNLIYLIIFVVSFAPFFSNAQNTKDAAVPTDEKCIVVNEGVINTNQLDYSPAFYEDGIVFISSNKVKGKRKANDKRIEKLTNSMSATSIFIARRGPAGTLAKPEPFAGELVSNYYDGPLTFDKFNTTIFFTRNNLDKAGKKILAKDGLAKLQIYTATRKDSIQWHAFSKLNFNDSESDNCHPSISVNGEVMIFASNRPGGFGGMDLYFVRKKDGAWSAPENLGPTVNTDKNEVFPYLHADGTLFFASDGHGGLGGLDVFFTKFNKRDNAWRKPKNVGKPLNSNKDDFGLIVDLDKKNGYLSSNREGGKGEDDIYSFNTQGTIGDDAPEMEAKRNIAVFAADKISGSELEGATVAYTNLTELNAGDVITDTDGKIIKIKSIDGNTDILSTVKDKGLIEHTDKEGKSKISIDKGDYLITVAKDGYQPKQYILKENDERLEIMALLEKAEGKALVEGILKDTKGKPVAGATMTIVDSNTGETQTVTTDADGKYKTYTKENSDFSVTATKNNYVSSQMKFTTKNRKDKDKSMTLEEGANGSNLAMQQISAPLAVGNTFQLTNVYHNFNDVSLRPDSQKDLDVLYDLMQAYPEVEIEVASHTDSRGSDEYNLNLSNKRAAKAKQYLVEKGIASNRIKAVGYGEAMLRNRCKDGVECSEAEHKYNRRTEVKILKAPPSDVNISYAEGNANGAASSSNNIGEFWVIAGSFEKPENAEKQIQILRNLGYAEVEAAKADALPFTRVRVRVCSSLDDAKVLLNELKSKQVPCFVVKY